MAYGTRGFGFAFALTPMVKRLIIANVAVFILFLPVGIEFAAGWFGFNPASPLARPWGVFTYMFVHAGFWHIFLNMLVLFFFGPPLEGRWGSREFLRFYLVCGMGGVLFSFLIPGPVMPIVGASAAIYGVMLAFAMNWPNAPIYIWGIFPVKAKYLIGFIALVAVFSAFGTRGGPVAHLAHVGGLVAALLYLKLDWRGAEPIRRLKKVTRVRRLAIVPRDEAAEAPTREATSWEPDHERRLLDEVDKVLDKISAEGMTSLTAAERRLLDEVSRRHRLN